MAKVYLILENGRVFEGDAFGAQGEVTGEVVFTTGMTGYLETLTDPSYHGQMVLQTFPLIGNYGVIPVDFESNGIGAAAYIAKHPCQDPSNFRSEDDLDTFLCRNGVVGICGVDTRALTKVIRESGVMNGCITTRKPETVDIKAIKDYRIQNPIQAVSCRQKHLYAGGQASHTVALVDLGMKRGILSELQRRNCDVWVFPSDSQPEEIMSVSPDGILLSNGPGDPAENQEIIAGIRALMKEDVPIFGICLGHQLLALASGFSTEKLKYGHRGANQPVKDITSGRVYITSQNHGYAVVSESIDGTLAEEWFVNINDGTCEGILYKTARACSVQFHPEARSGPQDTGFLFDGFVRSMEVKPYATQ